MIKKIAKMSAVMSYTFGKMAPFSSGLTLATVIALYTGIPWIVSLLVLVIAFAIIGSLLHFSGLFKEEQAYIISDLGGAHKTERVGKYVPPKLD